MAVVTTPLFTTNTTGVQGSPWTTGSIIFSTGLCVIGIECLGGTTFDTSPTSVTINGVTAIQIGSTIGDTGETSMWQAPVSAGSGTIVMSNVANSGWLSDVVMCGWTITGNSSDAPTSIGTLNATTSNNVDPQGPVSSFTVNTGGAAVGFIGASFNVAAGQFPVVWTPGAVVRDASTEVSSVFSNGARIGGAHISTSGTYTTVGCSGTSAPWQYSNLIFAAWDASGGGDVLMSQIWM